MGVGRVGGCGASSVAASDGSGCYFLDRVGEGTWRLQVYPSVLPVADPHTGLPCKKTVILADRPTLTVNLPDLGASFAVCETATGKDLGAAKAGAFQVAPGDYVLLRAADATAFARARAADLPAYWAPPPDPVDPSWRRWPPSREEVIAAARISATTAERWNFLDPVKASCAGGRLVKDDLGRPAVRYYVRDFVEHTSLMTRTPSPGWLFRTLFPEADEGEAVVLTGRSDTGRPEPVEFVLILEDGQTWGTTVTLPECLSDIRIPLASLRYFSHWKNVPAFRKGFRPDVRRLTHVGLNTGRWLNKETKTEPHAFMVTSLAVSAPRAKER